MKVNFNLRDQKAKTKTSIVLVVRHYQKSLKWSTGLHIHPTLWDVQRQRPQAGKLAHIREELNRIELIAEKLLMSSVYLQQSDFSRLMNESTGKAEPALTPYLLAFIRKYCETNPRQALKATAAIVYNFLTKESVTGWKGINWEKAKSADVRFDSINWDFRNRFVRYCFDQGMAVSYVTSNIRRLGQFINESRKAEHHTNNISKENGFGAVQSAGVEKAKNVPIALTIEELNRLAGLELTGLEERIRDIFLIGCMSGQRWSDYGFINRFQVRDGLLTIHQQEKTENFAEVELDLFEGLLPYSLGDLLEKYGNCSPVITEGKRGVNAGGIQTVNKYIKELCKRAGITEQVRWSDDQGGKITTYTVAKCELMGTHTCRRSFATIWFNLGMPCEEIISVTGHTTTSQLMTYIGATQADKRAKRRATVAKIKAGLLAEKKAI